MRTIIIIAAVVMLIAYGERTVSGEPITSIDNSASIELLLPLNKFQPHFD